MHVVDAPTPASRSPARSSRWTPSSGTPAATRSRCSSTPHASSGASRRIAEAGYAAARGRHRSSVVVDAGFADADGRPLAAGAFPPLRRRPRRPRTASSPRRGISGAAARGTARTRSSCASTVPLDHALLHHCLAVVDGDGSACPGPAPPCPTAKRAWEFTPDAPWPRARHQLIVDTTLEDLAGNSVARVFDRDLADPDHAPLAADHLTLDFTPL